MKIRKLQLKNIGVFDDETIEFQPCPAKDKAEIHILTGQNGSGKTTILQALSSLFRYLPNFHKEKESLAGFTDFLNIVGKAPAKNEQEEQFKNTFGNMFDVLQERLFEPDKTIEVDDFSKRFRFFEVESEIAKSFVSIDGFEVFGCPQCGNLVHSRQTSIYSKLSSEKSNSLVKNYEFPYAAFVYAGYRRIKDESINLSSELEENPLHQALNFIKDEHSKFTINQWIAKSLNNSLIERSNGNDLEANQFEYYVNKLEEVISDIIKDDKKIDESEIKFKLKVGPQLVLTKDNEELDFDVLPDGLKSLISWIGDLLMRLDSLKWKNDTPIFEREIILFLDEIEVHLHPEWQRKVLPVVQKLFKNSQIFVSTHSPFVVNSIDDAWVYKLNLQNGKAKVESIEKSEDGKSYSYVLEETFDIKEEFGVGVEKELDKFYQLRNSILSNGSNEKDIKKITKLAKDIAKQSEELNTIIQIEIRQINRKKGLNLKI